MSPHFGKAVPGWLQCRLFAALMCVSAERCVPLQLCLPQGRLEESDILVVDPLHIFGFHAFIHFFLSAYHPQCPVARSCIVELHVVWRLNFCFANLHPALILLPWSSYMLVTSSSLLFHVTYDYGVQAPCRSPWDAIHDLPSLRWVLHLSLFLPVRFYLILRKKMPITII